MRFSPKSKIKKLFSFARSHFFISSPRNGKEKNKAVQAQNQHEQGINQQGQGINQQGQGINQQGQGINQQG